MLNLVNGDPKVDAFLLSGISMVLKRDCIPIKLKSAVGMEVFVNPLPI